jgi:hypothetical protein
VEDLASTRHDTKGEQLAWGGKDAFYDGMTGSLVLDNQHWLSVRMAQVYEDAVLNPVNVPGDLFV